MTLTCREITAIAGCANAPGQPGIPVTIHYEYRDNGAGVTAQPAVRYTDAAGAIFTPPVGYTVSAGACRVEAAEFDHTILCDPATGGKVVLVIAYDAGTGVPHVNAYDQAGLPWVGATSTLVACETDLESDFVLMCDGGTTFLRWVIKKDGVPTGVVFDTDLSSAPYTVAGAPTVGECALSKLRIYLERNVGVVSISDIVAATGSDKILSVAVKQIAATGSVTADSGSGVPLSVGETWSWSAVSNGNTDTLYSSALTMDSGGGEQRITATYI